MKLIILGLFFSLNLFAAETYKGSYPVPCESAEICDNHYGSRVHVSKINSSLDGPWTLVSISKYKDGNEIKDVLVYRRDSDGYLEIDGGFPSFNAKAYSKERTLAEIANAYHQQINRLIAENKKLAESCGTNSAKTERAHNTAK